MAILEVPDTPLVDHATGVVLRPWREADAPALAAAWADPEVIRWNEVPDARGLADATRWIDGQQARRAAGRTLDLAVVGLADAAVRGEVGLVVADTQRGWAEVGFWSLSAWRGTGSVTAALGLLSRWALGPPVGMTRLFARVRPGNEASPRALEHAGFAARGTLDDGRQLFVRSAAATLHP